MWYLKIDNERAYMFDYYEQASYEAIKELQKKTKKRILILKYLK